MLGEAASDRPRSRRQHTVASRHRCMPDHRAVANGAATTGADVTCDRPCRAGWQASPPGRGGQRGERVLLAPDRRETPMEVDTGRTGRDRHGCDRCPGCRRDQAHRQTGNPHRQRREGSTWWTAHPPDCARRHRTNGRPVPGLRPTTRAAIAESASFSALITDNVSWEAKSSGGIEGSAGIELLPEADIEVIPPTLDVSDDVTIGIKVEDATGRRTVLLGSAAGIRIEARSVSLAAGGELGHEPWQGLGSAAQLVHVDRGGGRQSRHPVVTAAGVEEGAHRQQQRVGCVTGQPEDIHDRKCSSTGRSSSAAVSTWGCCSVRNATASGSPVRRCPPTKTSCRPRAETAPNV